MGLFESRETRENRERREREERMREHDEKRKREQEEQARLERKRQEVLPLLAHARADERFVDTDFRETYAHEHRDEVLSSIAEEIPTYQRWLMDEDFLKGQLCDPREVSKARQVWEAKQALVKTAGELTQADLTAWQVARYKEMEEATKIGLSPQEYRTRQAAVPTILADSRKTFDETMKLGFVGDDESRDMTAREMGFRSNAEMRQQADAFLAERGMNDVEMALSSPEMALAALSALASLLYEAKALGVRYRSIETEESLLMHLSRERNLFKSDEQLAKMLVTLDAGMHECAVRRIDEHLAYYEKNYPPGWGKLKVTVPWREWADEWKQRLGKPRTETAILTRVQQSPRVAKECREEWQKQQEKKQGKSGEQEQGTKDA